MPLYIILLGSGCILSSVLAIYAWRHRQIAGALSLSILMALVAGWSLWYAFELGSTNPASKVFWGRLQYIPIAAIPPAWVVFALEYAQHQAWRARRLLIGLSIAPILTILLQFTSDWHGLVWSSTRIDLDGPFPILRVTYGPWFWAHTAYSYLLLMLGSLLMVRQIRQTNYLFRWRSVVLLSAVLLPWLGNAVYLAGASDLDLTPFAFTLTGLLLTWSIVGFHLLDLTPTAREAVLESMRDGVLVLDQQGRIVDLNPAAARIFGVIPARVVGQTVASLHQDLRHLFREDAAALESQGELSVGADAERRIFEWRASPVYDRYGRSGGRIVLLRDVTEERRSAEERQQLIAMVEHSDDLIGMADLQGKMLYLNAGGRRMVGLRNLEAALERVMFDFLFPDDLPYFCETIVPEVLRLGHWRGDIRYRHFESGAPIPIYASIFLVRSLQTGEPRAFATVSRDITARKRAETRLRQQAHYLTVLNAMGQAAIEIANTDLLLQTLSRQMGELLGADASWIERESPTASPTVPAMAKQGRRGEGATVLPADLDGLVPQGLSSPESVVIVEDLQNQRMDSPDLNAEYHSVMVVPLLNGAERIGRAVVAFRRPHRFTPEEIALGEQAGRQIALALSRAGLYEEVANQNRRLEAMISSSRDGVALIGVNLRILVLNQAILRLLGLAGTPADWIGRHLSEVIATVGRADPEIATIIETELRRVLGGDRTPGTGEFTQRSRYEPALRPRGGWWCCAM
ncbi:MAG: histidine kinase N-terminal 7TM domain-containing protein [Oscillochloridaceae bacterium]|nr:PAS domain S-box protein [Chloroflexaceae bacterium]MDW8388682.1 histidine kinase N-terminal 7TM domain-containing protein [Oscillochloridaceae bacterium]